MQLSFFIISLESYKPESLGFETRRGGRISSTYLILAAAIGPEVYTASNRNEYQKQKNIFSGELIGDRRLRLTTSPLTVSRFSMHCGMLNILQTYRHSRPITGIALLLLLL
jgi:hypothetical protein